jgi:hypothetical protein
MDEKIIERLVELGLEDKAIALIGHLYDDGDISEEDIFDIGDDEDFNIDNIENYDLAEEPSEYYGSIDYNGEEWLVFDNDQEAYDAAVEDVKTFLEEEGVTGINFDNIGGMDSFVDDDWFRDAEKESFESYCWDIADEGDDTYDNRLVQECYDAGLITDDDFETDEDGEIDYTQCTVSQDELTDKYVDYHMDEIDDFVQNFIWNFGEEEFNTAVIEHNLIDLDRLAEAIVDADRPANTLASYDGDEYTYDFNGNTYYMYRRN